eukprot:3784748-Pyramimonas_sp.AAC.1
MGWPRAVNVCQHVVKPLILEANPGKGRFLVTDREAVPKLEEGAAIPYVDSIITICTTVEEGRASQAKTVPSWRRGVSSFMFHGAIQMF